MADIITWKKMRKALFRGRVQAVQEGKEECQWMPCYVILKQLDWYRLSFSECENSHAHFKNAQDILQNKDAKMKIGVHSDRNEGREYSRSTWKARL